MYGSLQQHYPAVIPFLAKQQHPLRKEQSPSFGMVNYDNWHTFFVFQQGNGDTLTDQEIQQQQQLEGSTKKGSSVSITCVCVCVIDCGDLKTKVRVSFIVQATL